MKKRRFLKPWAEKPLMGAAIFCLATTISVEDVTSWQALGLYVVFVIITFSLWYVLFVYGKSFNKG